MTGRELSENLNYLGMSSGIRKLALKEKLATAEKLAVMNEVEVCDLVANEYELVYAENEEIGLVRKDKMDEYNNGEIENIVGDVYLINLEDGNTVELGADDFEVERDGILPMWGWLWSFSDSADDYFMDELDGIKKMSECGFRIYEHDEWGYFFGIDGCGYSFYDEHWIPLYKKRGLQWHDPKAEQEYRMRMNGCEKKKLGTKECWFKGDEFVEEVL